LTLGWVVTGEDPSDGLTGGGRENLEELAAALRFRG